LREIISEKLYTLSLVDKDLQVNLTCDQRRKTYLRGRKQCMNKIMPIKNEALIKVKYNNHEGSK
jgi:hypothetical protein